MNCKPKYKVWGIIGDVHIYIHELFGFYDLLDLYGHFSGIIHWNFTGIIHNYIHLLNWILLSIRI